MSSYSIAYVSLISIALTLLFIHFRVWLSRRQDLDNLMFTLAALGAAMVGVLELLAFNTSSVEKYAILIKLSIIPTSILIVSITWFVWFHFKTGKLWLAISISAFWAIGLVINFIVGDNLAYLEIEGLKQLHTFTGETTYIPYGKANNWGNLTNLASILLFIYVIDATIILGRKGNRRRIYWMGLSIAFFIMIAGISAPLIDFGIIDSAYIISLPFAAVLIAMSAQLSKDVLDMFSLSKEMVAKQVRWSKLLKEIKLLVVGVDRKGMINYANPYFLEMTGFIEEELIGKKWINSFIPEHNRSKLKKSFSLPPEDDSPRHFKNNILTKAGEKLTIFWSIVNVENENGEFQEVIAVGNNVTEREEAFKKIVTLKQELEVENLVLKESFDEAYKVSNIIIKSDASKYAFQKAREVAEVDTTVLLQGETGVGKGVYARFIHEQSKRVSRTFLQVNCAAIPPDLLESELFGYEKGAFTGATKLKRGRFELANEGTLFLDEIGELPGSLQAKLLRVLQSGEFERLGSEKTMNADVRVIAATNRVLLEEVQKGNFREDLYYRINVFPITIPPLRKRKEDIPELTDYFVNLFQKKYEKSVTRISKQSYEVLSKYNWPGNIRELQNVIERAIISSKGDTLRIGELLGSDSIAALTEQDTQERVAAVKLNEVEKAHILKILGLCNWRIHGENGAAELLDINPSTLRSRMKKLDIRNKISVVED